MGSGDWTWFSFLCRKHLYQLSCFHKLLAFQIEFLFIFKSIFHCFLKQICKTCFLFVVSRTLTWMLVHLSLVVVYSFTLVLVVVVVVTEIGSHCMRQAILELTLFLRLHLDLRFSSFSLPCAGMTDITCFACLFINFLLLKPLTNEFVLQRNFPFSMTNLFFNQLSQLFWSLYK